MFNFVFYPWSILWCTFCCRRRLWWGIVSWTPCQCHCSSPRFRDLAGFNSLLSRVLHSFSSFTNNSTAFIKVSETAFSLTAGYFLAYWWYDKRVTVKEGVKNEIFSFLTFVKGAKLGQTNLDIRLLQELWTPLMKVERPALVSASP